MTRFTPTAIPGGAPALAVASAGVCWRSRQQLPCDSQVHRSHDEAAGLQVAVETKVELLPMLSRSVKWLEELCLGPLPLQIRQEEKRQNAWNRLSEFKRFLNECKLNRLEKKYHGLVGLTSYPDICIFVDEAKERLPISEMTRIGVPCVGLVAQRDRPVAVSPSIELVLRKLSEAIKKGKVTSPAEDRIRYMRRRSKRQGWQKALSSGQEGAHLMAPQRCSADGSIVDLL
eukprot:Skav230656  [mRNA]  locus=scaffold2185:4021:7071:+ [translate_table: standard]